MIFKKLIGIILGRKDGGNGADTKGTQGAKDSARTGGPRSREDGWRPGDELPREPKRENNRDRGPRPDRAPRDGAGPRVEGDGADRNRRRRRRGGQGGGPREEREGAPDRGVAVAAEGASPRSDRAPRPRGGERGERGERSERGERRGGREGRGGGGGGGRRRNAEEGGGVVLASRTPGVERPTMIPMNAQMEPGEFGPFQELDLPRPILQAVTDLGFTIPTPVQEQTIPIIQRGRDLIASAQTGTGKTAAFSLPVLSHLKDHGALRVLVLEPTRELAIQVGHACEDYSKYTDLRVAIICGGVNYNQQLKSLQEGPDVIAATPGRLLDHHENKHLSLDSIEIVILDEVDRMLDMGFLPDVQRIVKFCRNRKQTLMFSATMPPQIANLAQWALKDPEIIEIGVRTRPADTINHAFYPIAAAQKLEFVLALVEEKHLENVIVFTRTRMGADMVAERIGASGEGDKEVAVLHSDRSQGQRLEALNGFQEGKYKILVATDIAARGLHIPNVGHVINFDIPENPEDYVHRIGRTGRALSTGEAHTLVTGEDIKYMNAIEEYIGYSVPRNKLEGFEYVYNRMLDAEAGHTPGKFRSTRKRRR